jgi:GTP-binding protein
LIQTLGQLLAAGCEDEVKPSEARLARVAVRAEDYPSDGRAEIALMGRSNVGKSSLLNRLATTSGLARVSKTPGRTRELHFYLVEEGHYLVDLPGFGYAKTSKQRREEWAHWITSYIDAREPLVLVLQLVDIRHEPQPIDHQLRTALAERDLPACIVLTKADKLSRGAAVGAADALRRVWRLDPLLPIITTSSETGSGIPELQKLIQQRVAAFAAAGKTR